MMATGSSIGEVSDLTGFPAKTLRYYEDIGLVRPLRQDNGYRAYSPEDVDRLQFLKRARSLGFSIEDCRSLLELRQNPHRSNARVKAVAEAHLMELDTKIRQLMELRGDLHAMVEACRGDGCPDCAIIEGLSGH
jgi:Cu(I)-responsive transcriptional regulator